DLTHLRLSILASQPAAVDTADLAGLLERAEGRVHPTQPVEELVERRTGFVLVADVHDDGQTHDLLDPAYSGESWGDDCHAFFAFRIADWSDCANASL